MHHLGTSIMNVFSTFLKIIDEPAVVVVVRAKLDPNCGQHGARMFWTAAFTSTHCAMPGESCGRQGHNLLV
jgi:hypothetical protein